MRKNPDFLVTLVLVGGAAALLAYALRKKMGPAEVSAKGQAAVAQADVRAKGQRRGAKYYSFGEACFEVKTNKTVPIKHCMVKEFGAPTPEVVSLLEGFGSLGHDGLGSLS